MPSTPPSKSNAAPDAPRDLQMVAAATDLRWLDAAASEGTAPAPRRFEMTAYTGGAMQLAALWYELSDRQRFTLLCGYTAAHFAVPQSFPALQAICGAHTRVQKNTSDLLGNWLIARES